MGDMDAWDFASLEAARRRATFSRGVSLVGPRGLVEEDLDERDAAVDVGGW